MATVNAFRIEGLKLWFWSDDHDPPHFHAKKQGEWEGKVKFMLPQEEMIEVLRSTKHGQPSAKVKKLLTSQSEAHRAELLVELERAQGR